jgi:Rieske 2Fe-2S family protein
MASKFFFMNNTHTQSLLNNYKTGFSLEQPFYTSAEIFECEWQHIFKKTLALCRKPGANKKAGRLFLYHLQNEAIIVIRGNNGEVYAHYNTCRHRGSAICMQDKGSMSKLICPYHQWVYDKDGTLLNARMMPNDFCKSDYGLHSVHVQVVEGLIFISFKEVPPDFSSIRKKFVTLFSSVLNK